MIYKIRKIRFAGVVQLIEATEAILVQQGVNDYNVFLNSDTQDVIIISSNEKRKHKSLTTLAAIKSYEIVEEAKFQSWKGLIDCFFLGKPYPKEASSVEGAATKKETTGSKKAGN